MIIQLPLQQTYKLQSTTQLKIYSGSELAELEKNKEFLLTPSQNTTDEIILCLTSSSCTINLFSRVDGISMMERKSLEKVNLKLNLQFRVFEFTISGDTTLRMIKPNHRVDSYAFEQKGQTMYRKSLQEEESRTQDF